MSLRVEWQKTHLLPEPDSSFNNEIKLANDLILSKKSKRPMSQSSNKIPASSKGNSDKDSNVDDQIYAFIEEQMIVKTVAKLKEYQDLLKEELKEDDEI